MQEKLYPVSSEWARRAHIDGPQYEAMYAASVQGPEGFWYEQGGRIDWFRPFTKVKNTSFGGPGTSGEVFIRWFEDGVTNVAYNCINRHLERRGDQV
ncbi:MAG TPA: acetyl-coenzyme A synthetase N-terminal domain-containing protein, partial [Vicinamibacteria bacterium]|nr:acetyl-coenzyme A synthetase N-terminal domain-containing protein [Vicinamibacteria bacterium]